MTYHKSKSLTTILMLVTIAAFIMQIFMFDLTPIGIYNAGGIYGQQFNLATDFWRLVTPIFLHAGVIHIFMNLSALYVTGIEVESLFGKKMFLLIYLVSGIVGNLAALIFSPNAVTVGASGSIFGLFGAMAYYGYTTHNSRLQQLSQQYLTIIFINLALTYMSPNISVPGHFGGLIGGLLVTFIYVNMKKSK